MIALVIVIGLIVYILCRKRSGRSLLLNCGFPVLPSRNLIGENIDVFLSPFAHSTFGEIARKYGPIFGAMQGGFPTVVTSDADVVQEISYKCFHSFHAKIPNPLDPDPLLDEHVHMFASRGERWKRMRTITSEAMSTRNMKQLFPIVEESVVSFLNYLETLPIEKGIDAHKLFQNHTSDVLARCAFGQTRSLHGENSYHKIFSQAFGSEPQPKAFCWNTASICFPPMSRLFRELKKCSEMISRSTMGSISPMAMFSNHLAMLRSDRAPNAAKYDFLQFFKDAEDTSFDGFRTENGSGRIDIASVRVNKVMAPGETVAQCRFIAVAGFDTTANTLTLVCELLARNEDKQELLLKEIDAASPFIYDNILSMKYLHCCIFEALRLYPHASPLQTRLCMENCQVGSYCFRKGTNVVIDQWALHHNPKVWGDDVEEFRPERFDSLTHEQLRSFMPFGLGPRQCVGMRFALMEIKLTLSMLFSKYRLRRKAHKDGIAMTVRDTGTIWPKEVRINLERRR